jgi:short-subunit dehydrogenase
MDDAQFRDRYGRWAIVTGASQGTGRAYARQLAAKGLSVILIARRVEPLEELASEIRAESGVECVTAAIDISRSDATQQIIGAAGEREIGLVVFNAGADGNGSRFLDADIESWRQLVTMNVTTTIECCHHFGRAMRQRRRGGLLLVNSFACYGGSQFLACYTGSKAFMLCFAESLWSELQPDGVDVLTMPMGMTDTPAFKGFLEERGLPLPAGAAPAEEVAAYALANLANGPVQNWGMDETESGFVPQSAADRRARILDVNAYTVSVFGE